MPSVIDTPEMVEHEEHTLYEGHRQVRVARSGFWRTVVQDWRRQRTPMMQDTPPASHVAFHRMDTPADQ